jgi:hypothetical protein
MQNLVSFSFLIKNIKIKMYRIIILPFVLYGWEAWSLTQIEECRLRVFGNRVMKKIFGNERDEVTGVEKTTERRVKLSVLLTKYYSGDQIKKNEVGGAFNMYGEGEKCMQGFGGEA